MKNLIRDAYGRELNSLRLLVTSECNYRCFFCHLEGDPLGEPARPGSKPPLLTPEDYSIVAEAAWKLGIRSFKITGGEPLIRRDIVSIVEAVNSSAPGSDISMTTNGVLLESLASNLRDAGLKRINVSLHSLRRDRYKFITGVDGLDRVLRGLDAAINAGFRVKINALILYGVNHDEVFDLVEFSKVKGVILQLIELIPVGLGAKLLKTHRFSLASIEEKLRELGARVEVRELHYRPIYRLPNGAIVEIVRPYSNPIFCSGCNRLRIDSSGRLSPCINWRGERISILEYIRRAKSREEAVLYAMKALIEANWLRRPFYLFKRDTIMPQQTIRINGTRLLIPKKTLDLEGFEELRAQKLVVGGLESTAHSL
ncbi:MAG: GTP 3',8-cyclase MoaA [Acidilobaceae archaeon]